MTDDCVATYTGAVMEYGFGNTIISDALATRNRDLKGKTIPAE
ncbi:hypothetical protein SAMN05443667_115132 [Flavobacterium gillisiae]|uniref:Uncharacterized protein n=1 Tax=Flavobacterium gillisiae TaxID=150146 RepID=A0A1H4FYR6_9FLAO|nr:hypothetical protein SAMN05443667_115132 [Flavobacterium gillisiae]